MTRSLLTGVTAVGLGALLTAALAAPAAAQRVSAVTDRGSAPDTAAVAGTVPHWASPRTRVGDAPGAQRRTIQVALALRDQRGAEALARRISTPGSPQYRKHWTSRQFQARYAPTRETVDAVSAWLRSRGLQVDAPTTHHTIDATGTVDDLEAAFGVRIGLFTHQGKRLTAPETDVRVPARLRSAVTAVLGLDDAGQLTTPSSNQTHHQGAVTARVPRPSPRPLDSARPLASATVDAQEEQYCSRHWAESNNTDVPQKYPRDMQSNILCGYTAAQTRAIYRQTGANTGAGVHVAITGAYNAPALVADTARWAAESNGAEPLRAGQYAVVPPPGGYRDNPACADSREAWHREQTMDVQAVHTIAPQAQITWYAGSDCTDNYDALGRAIAANKATVITSSWNAAGENVSPATHAKVDAMLVQAAIQGQAVLFSSGDLGDNTGNGGRGTPQFPASSPWVTAVGGTTVALNADGSTRFTTGWQSAGNTLTSGRWVRQNDSDGPFAGGAGGGRSSLYTQPDYQRGAVPATVAQGKRTVPDVAALADAYTGMLTGFTASTGWRVGPGGGTSLASPLMAGLVANAQQAKGARLGFLNGALYATTSAMVDVKPVAAGIWTPGMYGYGGVTVPTTPGNYLIDLDARPQSLQSGPGWDPVTGVGTPGAGFVSALGRR